jgi:hypothetical protein
VLFDRYSEELRIQKAAEAREAMGDILENQSPEQVIEFLMVDENMATFKDSGGIIDLYRRISESDDLTAFNIVAGISTDENRYYQLEGLISKIYTKKEIGALILLDLAAKLPD